MTHPGKSSAPKGERGMNKYSVFKFVLASVACCMIIAAFLTGCGGSNNPAGASGGSTLSNKLPSTATGTVDLTGFLNNSVSNAPINDADANITVRLKLFGTDSIISSGSEANNSVFAAYGLTPGWYIISASDSTGRYQNTQKVVKLENPQEQLSLDLIPVPALVTTASLNFFGQIIDSTPRDPVMFATVILKNRSGITVETSTLDDGSFFFLGLASGTYDITISKSSFESTTRVLQILDDGDIYFGPKKITTTGTFKDGANTSRTGYNLGIISLAALWLDTGSIAGILRDAATKAPYANQNFDLIYDDNKGDEVPPASIIKSFTTNNSGYFFAKNLPAGWYLVATPGYTKTPVLNALGNTIGFTIDPPAGGVVPFEVWLQVSPGNVTPVPDYK